MTAPGEFGPETYPDPELNRPECAQPPVESTDEPQALVSQGSAGPAYAPATGAEPSESGWMGSLQSLAITVVIAVFVITFIVQAFQIPSESMEDTLLIGDYLLVDKAHFGPAGIWGGLLPYRDIGRGDIAVFRYPIHPSQHFVKRVIGVPGDRIRLVKKRVFVNGVELREPYVSYKTHSFDGYRDNFPTGEYLTASVEAHWYLQMRKLVEDGQLIVPEDSYFVLGDNRDESLDSRYWGFVPRENVIGRPLVIYWSVRSRDGDEDAAPDGSQDGKLARFGQALERVFHNMRWNRTFRLVR